jgi:nucleoside-diphosphate-sugar epimerase
VDDVAAAFEAALLRPVSGAHVFNLRGEIASVETIIAEIRKLVPDAELTAEGAPVPIKSEIAAHDMTEVLGPLPTTSLAEGLRRTVGFYQGVTQLAT